MPGVHRGGADASTLCRLELRLQPLSQLEVSQMICAELHFKAVPVRPDGVNITPALFIRMWTAGTRRSAA
jgi:hypothetical protein